MYPDKIIYKYNVYIEILKKQGISTYLIEKNRFYVLYSVFKDIPLGTIIIGDLSSIDEKCSDIYWYDCGKLKNKKIKNRLSSINTYIIKNNSINIKISSFEDEFLSKLMILSKSYKNVVIDVRDNTGGALDIMFKYASIFLKRPYELELFDVEVKEIIRIKIIDNLKIKGKLVILTDNTTYSSAEIFVKILKQGEGVKVIGESFGKNVIYKEVYRDEKSFILQKKFLLL